MHDPARAPRRALLVERRAARRSCSSTARPTRCRRSWCCRARTSTARAPTTRSSSPRTRRCSPRSGSRRCATSSRSITWCRRSSGRAREVETVILRPVHIVGPVHNAPSNYLRLERPPMLLGFDPMVQLIHEPDVADAIALRARPRAAAASTTSSGPARCRCPRSSSELGRAAAADPAPARQAAARRSRSGSGSRASRSPSSTSSATSAWSTASRAERELGFRARATLRETIRAVDEPA